ncbi:MAG: outer membrane protein transport protein, partial [Cocleimonas sp.]|nr:outer membrane protein transport protein [Cocleimonas sp.]
ASDCSLDLPAVVGVGISTQLSNKVKFVGDVQRVYWEGVPIFDELFSWKDQTVTKVGLEYQVSNALALRAGYNHGKSPIPASNTNRAILAPAVVEDHISIGFSKKMGKGTLSAYYARTLENEQKMTNLAGLPSVKMDQNALGVGYSVNF